MVNLIDTWYHRAILFENNRITYNKAKFNESLHTTENDRLHTTVQECINNVVVKGNGDRTAVVELKCSWYGVALCLCEGRRLGCESRVRKQWLHVDLIVEQNPVLMVLVIVQTLVFGPV